MDVSTVRRRIIALVAKHGTQRAVAALMGVSDEYLHYVLSGKRPPGPKVLKVLGLSKHTRTEYRPC